MPIHIEAEVVRLDQNAFGQIAHEVMSCVFAIHNDLGRFFDEKIYKRELQQRYSNVPLEVPVNVSFEGFSKNYFLDVLVESGATFEFKVVEALVGRHRSQLLHYLLLAELAHGKLINMRTEQVQHEFVNTSLYLSDRTTFAVSQDNWQELGSKPLRPWCEAFLRDVGTNLDLSLYEEALTYWLGGEEQVMQEMEVVSDGIVLGSQKFRLTAPKVALKITAFDTPAPFEIHAKRLLRHTSLNAIQWVNIPRKNVTFRTIEK